MWKSNLGKNYRLPPLFPNTKFENFNLCTYSEYVQWFSCWRASFNLIVVWWEMSLGFFVKKNIMKIKWRKSFFFFFYVPSITLTRVLSLVINLLDALSSHRGNRLHHTCRTKSNVFFILAIVICTIVQLLFVLIPIFTR